MGSGQKEGLAVAAGVAGLNVFVSFAFGFFVLKESYDFYQFLGTFLVILGLVLNVLYKSKRIIK